MVPGKSLQVPMSRDVAQMLCLSPAQWLDDTGFPLYYGRSRIATHLNLVG
jgi:hypothetical protein